MEGAGTTLSIAFFAVSIGAAFGTLIGGLTGYFGGIADEIIMRINGAITAFPSILLALVVVSITRNRTNDYYNRFGNVFMRRNQRTRLITYELIIT